MKKFILPALFLAPAHAASPAASPTGLNLIGGGQSVSAPMQVVILMTVLTMLPAVVMCVTPFLRITVVLHFLRQALGTQTTPSNQVLLGLALFLTILVMQPVATDVYHKGWEPMEQGKLSTTEAFTEGSKPLQTFLMRFAREKDIQLFLNITHTPAPRTPKDLDMKVLVPAYILSELKAGFQIGAILYLPFLVIDLVIASVTVSIGMMQLPPVMVSAPFKILLFVLADGWNLIIGSLMKSFYA
jgi:flagellar biosynthetic protein FliP